MKPITRKRNQVMLGVTLLSAVIASLIYLQLHQKQLAERLEPFDPQAIAQISQAHEELQGRTSAIEQHLNDQDNEQQLSELLVLQEETTQQLQQLHSLRTESDELRTLINARIESLEQEVAHLKEQSRKPVPPLAPAKPSTVSRKAVVKQQSAMSALPFALISIETRAGESFASVAPHHSVRLDQVRLLKSGESFDNWRLLRIEPDGKAVFSGHGQQHIVSSLQE